MHHFTPVNLIKPGIWLMIPQDITLKACGMSDGLKLTPSLLSMLERIERHSGTLLLLTVTASGGREYSKLNKLRGLDTS